MDDRTFELLKRIDAGFEDGSGPYGKPDFLSDYSNRGVALKAVGDEGLNLRVDIMKAVEAEKGARQRSREYKISLDCH